LQRGFCGCDNFFELLGKSFQDGPWIFPLDHYNEVVNNNRSFPGDKKWEGHLGIIHE
jgi:hypothetical protein